jgi:aspartyl-tRNA(Asn)/glutamyl-tRNA(Gln) amidotransferase subunit C
MIYSGMSADGCSAALLERRASIVSLTSAEVEHIALLARVGLSPEDVARFQGQLSVILDAFATLRDLDTTDVPPTAHTLPLANVERRDESRPSLPEAEALANAPETDDGFIRIRRVLD